MSLMTKEDWVNLDWSKSNKEIMALTGKTYSTVNTMRHRLGKTYRKQTQPPTDWDKVDWTINNQELAKLLNLSYDTVAKKRWELGVGESTEKATRKDKGTKKPQMAHGAVNQPKATESAKKSPIAGKFETNNHAKEWVLVAPDDKIYHVTNLHHFVRNNPHLFAEKDVIWKGKNGIEYYCNATAGIGNIKQGKSQSWKGWRLLNHDKNKD